MKVYDVYMTHDSGGHEQGYYVSPFFRSRIDAERFLEKLLNAQRGGNYEWWSANDNNKPHIREHDVIEEWDRGLQKSKEYFNVVYT